MMIYSFSQTGNLKGIADSRVEETCFNLAGREDDALNY
jgi:hypothetical protein